MTDLFLAEGGEAVAVRLDDQVGDTLAASGATDAHRLGGGLWEVSATTKVGVVSFGDLTVWVRPKVEIARILFLMGYARNPGWRTDDVELAAVPELLPALAGAFADQAERALEAGLLQGYVETDDSLTVLRGRLRDSDQLRQRFGLAIPLLVRYDDYTVDIPENRILRAASELLLRLPGVNDTTRQRLRGIRVLLADVGAHPTGRIRPSWLPTRLNARYHVALWLAELILAGDAVDQTPGHVHISGFLVDMAKVYEDFLVAAVTQSFQTFGGWCRPQDRHHLDGDTRIAMKPDLVWYHGGVPAAVIDAKYKVEQPSGFPNADIYQMLAYCTALGLIEGHLVYAKGNSTPSSHQVRNTGITIVTHTIDLSLAPSALLSQIASLVTIMAASGSPYSPP